MTDAKRTIIVDLLRHGEPEGGDILRGRINPKLTPTGWRQMSTSAALTLDPHVAYAAELGIVAPVSSTPLTPRWTKVISSPLERCQHFAAHAAAAHTLTPHVEDRWQEIDYGDWDGMPIDEWRKIAAPQFAEFRRDLSKLAPPNGENYLDFKRPYTWRMGSYCNRTRWRTCFSRYSWWGIASCAAHCARHAAEQKFSAAHSLREFFASKARSGR